MNSLDWWEKQAAKSDYHYEVLDGVLTIVDHDKGRMSVTNNLGGILGFIRRNEGLDLTSLPITYRDSIGNWDYVKVTGDSSYEILPMGERAHSDAIRSAKRMYYVINGKPQPAEPEDRSMPVDSRQHAAGECPVCEGQTLEYGEMVMAGDGSGNATYPWKCDFCESEGEENYNLQFLNHEVTKKGEIPQDE